MRFFKFLLEWPAVGYNKNNSGAILGIVMEEQFMSIKGYIFASLSGIFLYLSLSTLFPVLRSLILGDDHFTGLERYRGHQIVRVSLAICGFLLAMALIVPLVYYKNDLKYSFHAWYASKLGWIPIKMVIFRRNLQWFFEPDHTIQLFSLIILIKKVFWKTIIFRRK